MSNKHTLFVYGTLKRGFHNHVCLGQNATFIGEADLHGWKMYSLGGFPAIAQGDGIVQGEVYEVDDDGFQRCDRLEGYPSFYNRSEVEPVISDNGHIKLVKAWTYHFDKSPRGAPLVKDGIWK